MKFPRVPLLPKVVLLYFVIGLGLYSAGLQKPQHTIAAQAQSEKIAQPYKKPEVAKISGNPINIQLPTVAIDLPVEVGQYNSTSDTWKITSKAVYLAADTSMPNNVSGNSLLYGHNSRKVIGATKNLKFGDKLILKTDNGHTFIYSYTEKELVKPTDVGILSYNPNRPRLTLMTCDGLSNELRRLMYFDLVEAK